MYGNVPSHLFHENCDWHLNNIGLHNNNAHPHHLTLFLILLSIQNIGFFQEIVTILNIKTDKLFTSLFVQNRQKELFHRKHTCNLFKQPLFIRYLTVCYIPASFANSRIVSLLIIFP